MSRRLSYLLRHGAEKEGLTIDKEGYVPITELKRKTGFNLTQLQDITQKDVKGRFSLKEVKGIWYMRANQGHTISSVTEESLIEITDPNKYPVAVHGTFNDAWNIIKTTGLNKMARNHIHFAQGIDADLNETREEAKRRSGIRKNSDILIYANIPLALADGIKFYVSSNGVILTPGNENGYLEPKYFLKVTDGNDRPIVEKTIPKGKGPSCAGCVVFRKNKTEVCLIATHSKIYGFPKGKLNKGESHIEGALRELKEETGITMDQIEPLNENKYLDEPSQSGKQPAIRLFVTNTLNNNIKLKQEDEGEIFECKWFSIADAFKLLMPKRQQILNQALKL